MHRLRLRTIAVAARVLTSVACGCATATRAADPAAWSAALGVPTEFTLICGTDGSTTASEGTVQALPDGIHFSVVNEYDEPVSVGGFDADPGTTRWTGSQPPGRFDLSCWPSSQHGSGEEPPTTSIEIVDPSGLFISGEPECPGQSILSLSEYGEEPSREDPPPLDVARTLIHGLQPNDSIQIAGYPEQDKAPVTVVRDGEVIASYSFVRFDGQRWSIGGSTVCSGLGLGMLGRAQD